MIMSDAGHDHDARVASLVHVLIQTVYLALMLILKCLSSGKRGSLIAERGGSSCTAHGEDKGRLGGSFAI